MGLKSGFQLDNAVGDGRVNCRSDGFGGDAKLNVIGKAMKL